MNARWLLFLIVTLFLCFGVGAEDAGAFESVQDYLDRSVESGVVAGGAVLVWHAGEIVYATGFGYADIKSKRAFEVDTPVVVASISKPMLGTALYRLAQTKELEFDAPITTYLPLFKGASLASGDLVARPPTVTELLTHTAGLRPDSSPAGRVWFQPWTKNKSLEEVVDQIAEKTPFASQPGKKMAYSGIGTEVAARVGEVVSGQPRNEMLRAYLCKPLGMDQTYYRDKDALKQIVKEMPTRYYREKESGKLKVSRNRFLPDKNRYSSSGGTIISNAPDLLKWLLMIRYGGIHDDAAFLSQSSMGKMLAAHRIGNRADGGLAILKKDQNGKPVAYGHTGSSGTSIWMDAQSDTIGIMLTQTKGSDIRQFRIELERLIADAVSK